MSVQAMAHVWELDLPHQEMLVLLALADHADHLGEHIYPSLDLLAWKTGYSVRQIQRILQGLVTKGLLIKVQDGRGRSRTTEYALNFSKAPKKDPLPRKHVKMSSYPDENHVTMSPFPEKPRHHVAFSAEPDPVKHDILSKKHDIAMSPKPSGTRRENQEEDKTPPFPPLRGELPGFQSWWAEYPEEQREAEDICRRLWRRKRLETRAADILAHTKAMVASKAGREQFIPYSKRYLQEARYEKAVTGAGGAGRSTDAIHQAMLAGLDAQGVTYERGGI